jgi:hypothetical protein
MTQFFAIFIFVLAAISGSANATPYQVSIDFEYFPGPDGLLGTADDIKTPDTFFTPLTSQYASLGLNFEIGALFQFDRGGNHLLYGTWPIGTFSVPVHELNINNGSFWNVFLTGYDIDGNVIATDASVRETNSLKTRLSITSELPIYRFSLASDGDRSKIIGFDNLSYSVDPTEVPEPEAICIFLIALAGLGFWSRKSDKREQQREQGRG